MGKQAKKKDDKLKGQQKHHNSQTRGVNTTKQGALWAIRRERIRGEDGKPQIVENKVFVPINTGWNPSYDATESGFSPKKAREKFDKGIVPEPFDAIDLDWANEMKEYVSELNENKEILAWVERQPNYDGSFTYSVLRKHVDFEGIETIFSVDSKYNLNFGKTKGKFTKKVKD